MTDLTPEKAALGDKLKYKRKDWKMIKGVFGFRRLAVWFKCVLLNSHCDAKLPVPPDKGDSVVIYKCRYCGRTLCDY